ncbi:unnamed protein product [Durusdinium trenchii]|uniref:DUF7802 domain-containing protein n=1 Tax=Durusdinium trenchii TaxID=1381693 RepID=A0ABP0JHB2_9DINO
MDSSWLILDHFRDYDKWPWQRVNPLEQQLEDHPSFVFAEVLFILLAGFAFLHATCETDAKEERRLKLIWLATFIVGTVNDYIFMLLPVVDNFWQAQGLVMLTPRMPLYIPCVYNGFMYWSTVAAARVFQHWRPCAIAEASLAGLLAMIFYAPYDMCGAKFLWWTWHDTDPGVALRWLGVPGGSTAWTITFTFCFSLLLRLGSDLGWSQIKTLALACWSTPLMLVVLNIFTIIGFDRVGMPGPQTVLAAALCFAMACVCQPIPKVWPQKKVHPLKRPEHWSVRATLCMYFATLVLIGLLFSPEKQVSTGVHQQFGDCHATDIDLMGYERKRYICRERFPTDYFQFNCPEVGSPWSSITPEASMTDSVASWYTVCGRPHRNYKSWLSGLLALCGLGSLLFYFSFSLCQAWTCMTGQRESVCLVNRSLCRSLHQQRWKAQRLSRLRLNSD